MAFGSVDNSVDILLRAKTEGLEQIKQLEQATRSASTALKSEDELLKQLQASHTRTASAIDSLTKTIDQNTKALQSRSQQVSSTISKEGADWQSFAQTVGNAIKNPLTAAGDGTTALITKLGMAGLAYGAFGTVAGAALKGTYDLFKELGDEAERISNISIRTGLDVQTVQEFQSAAKYAGVEVGVFEQMMKGLTKTLTDSSKEGEKARNTLKEMGVTVREQSGNLRSTRDILLEFADAMDSVADGAEKQEKVRAVLGKIGGEMLPLLNKGLRENIELQEKWGAFFTDAEIQKYQKIDKALDTLGLGFDALATRAKAAIAEMLHLPQIADAIQFSLTGQLPGGGQNPSNGLSLGFNNPLKNIDKNVPFSITTEADRGRLLSQYNNLKTTRMGNLQSQVETNEANIGVINGIDNPTTYQLNLRNQLIALNERYKKQIEDIKGADAKAAQEAKKDAEAQKRSIEEAHKAYEGFIKGIADGAAKADGPFVELTHKFDELNKKFGGKNASDTDKITARAAYIREMVRIQTSEFAAIDKSMQDFGRDTDDLILREAEERSKKVVSDLTDAVKSSMGALYNPDFAYADSNRVSNLQTQEQRDARLRSLTAGPGNEGRVIDETYNERLDIAKKIYDINLKDAQLEVARAETSGDVARIEKARFDLVKTQGDYQKELDDAKYNRQVSYLELQKQELEHYKEAAGRIFDAVTASGGGGLKNFFSTELKTVERQMFVNASGMLYSNSSLGLGNIVPGQRDSAGNLTGIGKILQGTLFGSKGTTVEDYTRRTAIATEKIASGITNVSGLPSLSVSAGGSLGNVLNTAGSLISDANGLTGDIWNPGFSIPIASYGGGGSTASVPKGAGAFFAGAMGLASGANVWKAITGEDYGIQTGPGQAVTASSRGYTSAAGRAGTIIGAAGALYAGTEGAIAGFSQGGVGGVANGISSIVGTAAALDPEPISKAVLAGVALVSHIVGDIFGRSKEKRAQEIERYIDKNQSTLPEAIAKDIDISGAAAIYQSNGRVRAAGTTVVNHWNVQTMDAKSFQQFANDNHSTFASAVNSSLQLGHPLSSTIGQQFAN